MSHSTPMLTKAEIRNILSRQKIQVRIPVDYQSLEKIQEHIDLSRTKWIADGRCADKDDEEYDCYYIERLDGEENPTEHYICIGKCPFIKDGQSMTVREMTVVLQEPIALRVLSVGLDYLQNLSVQAMNLEGFHTMNSFVCNWSAKYAGTQYTWQNNPLCWIVNFTLAQEASEANE